METGVLGDYKWSGTERKVGGGAGTRQQSPGSDAARAHVERALNHC